MILNIIDTEKRRENLQIVRMGDGEGGGVDPLVLRRRAEIRDAYARLLTEHPALPTEIRDFQVQLETCSLAFNCIHHRLTSLRLRCHKTVITS